MSKKVRLKDAPPGLFRWNGVLGFKAEYCSHACYPDAYVVESGEFFWGGAKFYHERDNVMVEPVTVEDLLPDAHKPEKKQEIIAVDFDGTLCENKWPGIGAANRELITYLQDRQKAGAKLILWTCRTGDRLREAVEWCKEHGLVFDAINDDIPDVISEFGPSGRKVFATEYIDDRASTKFKLPFVKGE